MSFATQGSLLDLGDVPELGPLGQGLRRTHLSHGAWLDACPGWLQGSDAVFDVLQRLVPWRAERRTMYDNVVDVPRLTTFYEAGEPLPIGVLDQAMELLNDHYAPELGERFATAGLCLYRDGRDSVAWHGDTIGRGSTQDTMVAILSLGSARTIALRPKGGGTTAIRVAVGHGDLVVMGGSCQRTWEHAVPKTAKPVGARISVQFRPVGVR